ncbi:MAG: hypothetical protein QGG40_22475, partial [Myxococcota bacterium]|nr:hypothetical protein [Myxococcota bacterium]
MVEEGLIQKGERRDSVVRSLGVLGWFTLLFALITWPLASNVQSRVVGDPFSGVWRNLWGFWWTSMRLLRDGSWPLEAPEIAFPDGGPFSTIAPVHDFLAFPLVWMLELPLVYNLQILVHVVAAAAGTAWLARLV